MRYTVARLIHRVPPELRHAGSPSISLVPDILKAAQPAMRARSAAEAVWSLIDPESRHRHMLMPVPIAFAQGRGDRGKMAIALGLDMDGAVCVGWREGGISHLTRPADGGLTDPVRIELDHLLDNPNDIRGEGPLPGSMEVIREIHRALMPEVIHREVPAPDPGQAHPVHEISHPWHDDVFAAIAKRHGADQRHVRRPAPQAGKRQEWRWLGDDPREQDGTPIPNCITGLPASFPYLHLRRQGDADRLTIGAKGIAYDRISGTRRLRIIRKVLPETLWALIGPGMRADAICDMPGLTPYEVESIEEGETSTIVLRRIDT